MTPDLAPPGSDEPPRDPFSARDALLAWMQEIAPYGIFTTDRKLEIRTWNHWLVSHSGLSAEKVIGRSLLEVFPDVATRRLDERYLRAVAGEVSVLSAALHKYLLPFPASPQNWDVPQMLQTVRIAPLPAGELIVGTITIVEDVTERECQALILQRQQEHDRLLSAALGVLLQSDDPMRDVADLFPSITPSLGIEAYFNHVFDPLTQTLRLSAAAGLPPKQKEALATLALGEGPCGKCALQKQRAAEPRLQENNDPKLHDLRASGLRMYYCFPLVVVDRLLGTLSVGSYTRDSLSVHEVGFLSTLAQYIAMAVERTTRESQLREAQLTLRQHADDLEAKVTERTARLHNTIAQLESFSYTVAHDLRAPIRALEGYATALAEDYGRELPADALDIVSRLQRAGNRLDALTRDLLRFSKIARANVELTPVDLTEVVQDVVLLTPAVGPALTVHAPLGTVLAQRTLLHQCFSNLFDNAIKFVAPGVTPSITVRSEVRAQAAPSSGSTHAGFHPSTPPLEIPRRSESSGADRRPWLRIWFEDNGVGIPSEARDKIFGIFERLNGTENTEGTGIGLAIVARAMQQMGGTCGVESAPGQGSRFWLELPMLTATV